MYLIVFFIVDDDGWVGVRGLNCSLGSSIMIFEIDVKISKKYSTILISKNSVKDNTAKVEDFHFKLLMKSYLIINLK